MASSSTLEESCLQRLNPKALLQTYLDNQVRPDGRSENQARPFEVSIGDYDACTTGSAKVAMGQTVVSVGVTLQVGTPSHEAPKKGDIDVEISLGALCSSRYEKLNNKTEDLATIELLLADVLNASTVFNLKQLCIEKGQFAFRLKISGVCISHDGNLADAFLLAAVFALMHSNLPGTKIENDEVVFDPLKEAKPIVMKQIPIPVTYGIVKDRLLLDPTLQEENYMDGYIRAVLLDNGSVQYISQINGGEDSCGLNAKRYLEVLKLCEATTAAMRDTLKLHVAGAE